MKKTFLKLSHAGPANEVDLVPELPHPRPVPPQPVPVLALPRPLPTQPQVPPHVVQLVVVGPVGNLGTHIIKVT